METSVRIFLFISGAIIITGIIWDAQRRKNAQQKRRPMDEIPNELIQALDEELVLRAPTAQASTKSFREEQAEIKPLPAGVARKPEASAPPDFVSLSVMARYNQTFAGSDLLMAFKALDLHYGEHEIFHRYEDHNGYKQNLFSVASALKPGIFKLDDMNRFTTRGLTLFMTLSEPPVSTATFELMLRTARHLAIKLKGELKDSRHEDLTIHAIETMREHVRLKMKESHDRQVAYESNA